MAENNSPPTRADGSGCFNELIFFERNHLAAHHASHSQPIDRSDYEKENHNSVNPHRLQSIFELLLAQHSDNENDHENEWDRIQHIDDSHHDVVDAAAEIAGHGAVRHADHKRHHRRHEADKQRNTGSPEQ